MIDLDTLLNLALVLLLVAINGYFVAAEFALVAVRATRVDQLVSEGNRLARIVQKAKNDPQRFLAAAQIGITLASLVLGWIAEPTIASVLLRAAHAAGLTLAEVLLHTVATIIAFIMVTYMHIVLGESIPKALALQRTEPVVLFTALPMEFLSTVCTPFIAVLNRTGQWLLDRLGIEGAPEHHMVYSEEELKRIVTASHEVGVLEAQEQAMLHKVFAFSDRVAREVMVPRPDMNVLPVTAGWEEVLAGLRTHGHTRTPVYEDTIDNILGVLHSKDLFTFLHERSPAEFELRALLREVPFVPENKPVDQLLAEFRKGKAQIAIVMDEFGGTAGLVTIEDLLEEIVGEIEDEFDEPEPELTASEPGHYALDGRYRIADFNERFGADLPTEDFDTMAGLIFGSLGREPQLGDTVTLEDRFFVVIEAMEGHRITRLGVRLEADPAPELLPPTEPPPAAPGA